MGMIPEALLLPKDHPEVLRRITVCRSGVLDARCPYLRELRPLWTHEVLEQCGKCHCVLDIKARLPMFHCPLGLW
jgi:hypothetical protein